MTSSLYISFLAIIFLTLTIRVIKIRRIAKISIGDGGNPLLQRAIRAQSNFCESSPIAIIMLILAEAGGLGSLPLHFCGIILVLGRISHAYGISKENENFRFRITGMFMTFAAIITLTIANLILYFLSF